LDLTQVHDIEPPLSACLLHHFKQILIRTIVAHDDLEAPARGGHLTKALEKTAQLARTVVSRYDNRESRSNKLAGHSGPHF
jgi:hypothetical protein